MRALTLAFASMFAAAAPATADYMVKEVGSFHVGGRTETLTGLSPKGACRCCCGTAADCRA
jgi:hypothetical protein